MEILQKRDIMCQKQDAGFWTEKRDCPAQKCAVGQPSYESLEEGPNKMQKLLVK